MGGCHPPPAGCPPTCLTHSHHLLRFAGQGFTAARFSVHTLVLHLFHMAACGFSTVSSVCDSGSGEAPMSRGKQGENNVEFGSLLKCLKLYVTFVRLCGEGTVFVSDSDITASSPEVTCRGDGAVSLSTLSRGLHWMLHVEYHITLSPFFFLLPLGFTFDLIWH